MWLLSAIRIWGNGRLIRIHGLSILVHLTIWLVHPPPFLIITLFFYHKVLYFLMGSIAKIAGMRNTHPSSSLNYYLFYMFLVFPLIYYPLAKLLKLFNVALVSILLCVYFRISRQSGWLVWGMKQVVFITLTFRLPRLPWALQSSLSPFQCNCRLGHPSLLFWNVKWTILVLFLLFIVRLVNLANTIMCPCLLEFLVGFLPLLS
jgi:hypothetical protein